MRSLPSRIRRAAREEAAGMFDRKYNFEGGWL